MTRRGLFGALLGGVAAGLGLGKATVSTDRFVAVADDPNLVFEIVNQPSVNLLTTAQVQFAARAYPTIVAPKA